MRVNIYAEEMTDRLEIIGKEIDGHTFTGLRFYLELPCTIPDPNSTGQFAHGTAPKTINVSGPFMHRPGDDDSSAVTFWGKRDLRTILKTALGMLDAHYADSGLLPHEQRVVAEHAELDDRLNKLSAFLLTDTFDQLGVDAQDRLRAQVAAMSDYSNVLSERIAAFTG